MEPAESGTSLVLGATGAGNVGERGEGRCRCRRREQSPQALAAGVFTKLGRRMLLALEDLEHQG